MGPRSPYAENVYLERQLSAYLHGVAVPSQPLLSVCGSLGALEQAFSLSDVLFLSIAAQAPTRMHAARVACIDCLNRSLRRHWAQPVDVVICMRAYFHD